MKLFIDTNLWLRFFIRDNEEHYFLVEQIFCLNDESKLKLATSTFVLSEFVYTQKSYYKISLEDTLGDLQTILSVKNLTIVEKTDLVKTMHYYSANNRKWSDCVIAAQVPLNYKLCSFDVRLERIIGKNRFISPKIVVQSTG